MSLKTDSRWSNWSWDKPVKAFIWRSSRMSIPIGGLPPWFFEDSLPDFLLRNNSIIEDIILIVLVRILNRVVQCEKVVFLLVVLPFIEAFQRRFKGLHV